MRGHDSIRRRSDKGAAVCAACVWAAFVLLLALLGSPIDFAQTRQRAILLLPEPAAVALTAAEYETSAEAVSDAPEHIAAAGSHEAPVPAEQEAAENDGAPSSLRESFTAMISAPPAEQTSPPVLAAEEPASEAPAAEPAAASESAAAEELSAPPAAEHLTAVSLNEAVPAVPAEEAAVSLVPQAADAAPAETPSAPETAAGAAGETEAPAEAENRITTVDGNRFEMTDKSVRTLLEPQSSELRIPARYAAVLADTPVVLITFTILAPGTVSADTIAITPTGSIPEPLAAELKTQISGWRFCPAEKSGLVRFYCTVEARSAS